MYVIKAPKDLPITPLGRREWRGKLAGITSSQTKVSYYLILQLLINQLNDSLICMQGQRETAFDEDDDDEVDEKCAVCPKPGVWDEFEKVFRCKKCHYEIPSDDVGDDCDDNMSEDDSDDHDPDAYGGSGSGNNRGQKRRIISSSSEDADDSGAEAPRTTEHKRIKSAKNVAARVCDWVVRLGISTATIIYSNQQHYINSTLLASQRLQHMKIVEQEGVISNQQKRIDLLRGTIAAQQQQITFLVAKVEELDERTKRRQRGRPAKVEQYEQFTQFMMEMVMQMQSTGNIGAIKTTNPVDGLAQHIATMVEQQRQ